jgi:phytoene dehydrogenase-like protein
MGSISEALADAARASGAEIRTDCAVARIAVDDGRAVGAVLDDGALIEARTVISNADPQHTLLGLLGREALPESLVRELEALDFRSPSLKINAALARLPHFTARPGNGVGPQHVGTIHIGATDLDALEDSFDAARAGRLPDRPMIELTLPSALDPGLAPPGRHVASLFVQHVPARLAHASWDSACESFADRVFSLVDEVAPGFTDSVLEREVLPPPRLERIFGLTGGNIFHGAMTLDRLLFLRPFPGWSRYRTPVRGLYLCGAGTHPGGGVMGACGRNAAGEVLRDLRSA